MLIRIVSSIEPGNARSFSIKVNVDSVSVAIFDTKIAHLDKYAQTLVMALVHS